MIILGKPRILLTLHGVPCWISPDFLWSDVMGIYMDHLVRFMSTFNGASGHPIFNSQTEDLWSSAHQGHLPSFVIPNARQILLWGSSLSLHGDRVQYKKGKKE